LITENEKLKIVLASGSPRRLELLKMIGLDSFEVIPDTQEEVLCQGLTPKQTVCKTALTKAKNVSLRCGKDCLIIAADTEVYLEGTAFGKPKDTKDAHRMLRTLSGRRHTVYTGIALIYKEDIITAAEATEVYFRDISDTEIWDYVKTGEPMDKAGAYGAQGRGAVFVEKLEGDFFNVMGLPVCRLSTMLKNLGVQI